MAQEVAHRPHRVKAVELLQNKNKSDRLVADGEFEGDVSKPQVVKPMVRRGRIELPTHGFSVQDDEDE